MVMARLLLGPRTADRGRVAQCGVSTSRLSSPTQANRGTPGIAFLTEKLMGSSRKPAFIGMSRGGVNAYAWATDIPDRVACIYADNPALRPESLAKLGDLAQNDVPLLHICGSHDFLLQKPLAGCREHLISRSAAGSMMMIKEGVAHHPHSLRDPQPIADWICKEVERRHDSPPAFVGQEVQEVVLLRRRSTRLILPKEQTYVSCRGPYLRILMFATTSSDGQSDGESRR